MSERRVILAERWQKGESGPRGPWVLFRGKCKCCGTVTELVQNVGLSQRIRPQLYQMTPCPCEHMVRLARVTPLGAEVAEPELLVEGAQVGRW